MKTVCVCLDAGVGAIHQIASEVVQYVMDVASQSQGRCSTETEEPGTLTEPDLLTAAMGHQQHRAEVGRSLHRANVWGGSLHQTEVGGSLHRAEEGVHFTGQRKGCHFTGQRWEGVTWDHFTWQRWGSHFIRAEVGGSLHRAEAGRVISLGNGRGSLHWAEVEVISLGKGGSLQRAGWGGSLHLGRGREVTSPGRGREIILQGHFTRHI